MDQKPVRTFNVVMADVVILLLEEQAKKHPTSEASSKAAGLLKEFKAVSKPTETASYPSPSQQGNISSFRERVPIVVNPDAPSRVPIAGTDPRPRDEGEEKGAGGIGGQADLI